MKLVWTEPAVASLRAIHDYIAVDNPFYAGVFAACIASATIWSKFSPSSMVRAT